MSDLQTKIGESFAAQGLMKTIGAQITHVAEGEVHIALPFSTLLSQQHGYVHAGAIASILDTACGYAATWERDLTLAVNLSPAQFKTQDIEALVKKVLAETGLEPNRLELEITEATLLQNTDAVVETLTRLDQIGVSIAMDDFGTGYSSLSYLTRFPVKKIKIDRSFIDTLGVSPQTSAIVSSIVGLGQSLHVIITAEGVETEDQAEMLKQWGCDQVQGFYYGRPEQEVPESEQGHVGSDRPWPGSQQVTAAIRFRSWKWPALRSPCDPAC